MFRRPTVLGDLRVHVAELRGQKLLSAKRAKKGRKGREAKPGNFRGD